MPKVITIVIYMVECTQLLHEDSTNPDNRRIEIRIRKGWLRQNAIRRLEISNGGLCTNEMALERALYTNLHSNPDNRRIEIRIRKDKTLISKITSLRLEWTLEV